jgi:hypothetical protein
MPITISTQKSKETITRLIRNDFDKIDFSMDYIYGKAKELIQTAKELGLDELAQEMTNDLN